MKLLIVDDEPDLRELMSTLIQNKLHIDTVVAGSVAEAIAVLENTKDIAGIICDYNMKQGSGADLFMYLNSKNIKIPFILCSGDSLENHKEFDGYTIAGFLQKPFLIKEIISKIQAIFLKTDQ